MLLIIDHCSFLCTKDGYNKFNSGKCVTGNSNFHDYFGGYPMIRGQKSGGFAGSMKFIKSIVARSGARDVNIKSARR